MCCLFIFTIHMPSYIWDQMSRAARWPITLMAVPLSAIIALFLIMLEIFDEWLIRRQKKKKDKNQLYYILSQSCHLKINSCPSIVTHLRAPLRLKNFCALLSFLGLSIGWLYFLISWHQKPEFYSERLYTYPPWVSHLIAQISKQFNEIWAQPQNAYPM